MQPLQICMLSIENFAVFCTRELKKLEIPENIFCFCLFAWILSSHSRFFHSFGDVTITGERLQILTYVLHLWPLSIEGSLACQTYCDTGHPFIHVMVISKDPWHSHLFCHAFDNGTVTICFNDKYVALAGRMLKPTAPPPTATKIWIKSIEVLWVIFTEHFTTRKVQFCLQTPHFLFWKRIYVSYPSTLFPLSQFCSLLSLICYQKCL